MLKEVAVRVSPPEGRRGVRVMKSMFREPMTAMGAAMVVVVGGGVFDLLCSFCVMRVLGLEVNGAELVAFVTRNDD